MAKRVSNLGMQGLSAGHKTCGTGFVVVPDLISRQDYIERCFNTSYISIFIEGSGIINNVVIDEVNLEKVIFPDLPGALGSQVVYVTDQEHQQLFIVSVLAKQGRTALQENIRKVAKTVDDTTTALLLNPVDGTVSITVQSVALSQFLVNLLSENESALFQAIVNGVTNFVGKALHVTQNDEVLLKVRDKKTFTSSFISIQPKTVQLGASERIELGQGQEAAVLGNMLSQFLEDFITEVSNSTVTTPQGQAPLLNKVKLLEFKKRLPDLLSDLISLE